MEINETIILDDRGFVKINGDEAKSFLQNIITNDIEKITDNFTLFSSIFTPQGKYLYEFFYYNALQSSLPFWLKTLRILHFSR